MRKLLMLLLLLTCSSALSFGRSPDGSWQAVEAMPPGWQITVVAGHKFPCIFVRATEDDLICGRLQRGWMMRDFPEIHFRRDQIREVRVDRGDDANILAGAAIGGGAGAAFGAIAAESSKGAAAFIFGTIGTALGARLCQNIHVLRGKVIYRSGPRGKEKKLPKTVPTSSESELTARTSP
jgi:hypothetical protein